MKSELHRNIEADLYRHHIDASFSWSLFLRIMFTVSNPGLRFMMIFRFCQHYRRRNRVLFYFYYRWWRALKYRYGIDISYRTQLGKGFYIGHFGGIVVHGDTVIGENCNISQGTTIGVLHGGKLSGVPTIGDRVFIGPGAVILGGCKIGNDVLVGTNAVVTFDVPENSVVAPAKSEIISSTGSSRYVGNIKGKPL